MDYQKVYNLIILKHQQIISEGYVERHHIIPRCMGGLNIESNLVKLPAREHFIAHQLLAKIYRTRGLVYAAFVMSKRRQFNSKKYAWLKEAQSIAISISNTGRRHTLETKQKLSKIITGRKHSKKTRKKMSKRLHPYFTSEEYKETRERVAESHRGRKRPEETRAKLQKLNEDRAKIKYSCPHCSKEVDIANLKRWHGDNCKQRC